MKEYRFKENRISEITGVIGAGVFLLGGLSMIIIFIISLFPNNVDAIYGLVCFLISLPIAALFLGISASFSQCNKFTKVFIEEIKEELAKATTLESLYIVSDKLWDEAVNENKMIRLSYPLTIKKLMDEIHYKIDILKKQQP